MTSCKSAICSCNPLYSFLFPINQSLILCCLCSWYSVENTFRGFAYSGCNGNTFLVFAFAVTYACLTAGSLSIPAWFGSIPVSQW